MHDLGYDKQRFGGKRYFVYDTINYSLIYIGLPSWTYNKLELFSIKL